MPSFRGQTQCLLIDHQFQKRTEATFRLQRTLASDNAWQEVTLQSSQAALARAYTPASECSYPGQVLVPFLCRHSEPYIMNKFWKWVQATSGLMIMGVVPLKEGHRKLANDHPRSQFVFYQKR